MVEQAKITLSTFGEVTIDLEPLVTDGQSHPYIITREDFEECNKELFEKAINITLETVDSINLDICQIREIVLIGGSSQIPKIREMLASSFPGITINSDIDCDRVVSLGATIYAKQLIDNAIIEVKEVATHVITMKGIDGLYPIVDKNTPIPDVHSLPLLVDQPEAYTELFEDGKSLGRFTIRGIPVRGGEDTILNFNVSVESDGTLKVYGEVNGQEVSCIASIQKKSEQSDEIRIDRDKVKKFFEK